MDLGVKKKIYKKMNNQKKKVSYEPDYCEQCDETFTGPMDIKQEYDFENDDYVIPEDPPEWSHMLYPNSGHVDASIPDPPVLYGNSYNRNILQSNWTREQEFRNVRKRFPDDELDNENYYISKFTLPSDSQPAMNWVSPHLDLAFNKPFRKGPDKDNY